MAIKFDPDYNREIRRIVYNFNRKRNRAIKRGIAEKYLPEKRYVSDLKMEYSRRSALNRELRNLEKFNKLGFDAFEVVETLGGGRTSRYNLEYLKNNLRSTKEFYDRQIEEAKLLYEDNTNSMSRREYLFNLEEKRKYLELDIDYLDESGLKTFAKYTRQAQTYNLDNARKYRNFLAIVEQAMDMVGFSNEAKDSFFAKFNNLSPAEFIKLYQRSNMIQRVYDLYVSSTQLNTDDEDASRILTNLTERIDEEIASLYEK